MQTFNEFFTSRYDTKHAHFRTHLICLTDAFMAYVDEVVVPAAFTKGTERATEYKPSKKETLLAHYGPPELPCYNFGVCDNLVVDNLLKQSRVFYSQSYYEITEKGRHAVEFLRGQRIASKYPMPNWVLKEATA